MRTEEVYGDYRKFDGVLKPMKVVVFRDGKKVMAGERTEVKHLDKIDAGEFAKP